MLRFLIRRSLASVGVLWAVATVVFIAIHASGDPISAAMASIGITAAQATAMRHALGLDKPLLAQYWHFVDQALHGKFGDSFQNGQGAMHVVLDRLPYTIELAAVALGLTIVVALALGLGSAYRRGGIVDRLVLMLTAVGQSVPAFVAGPLLIVVFAVSLHMLPVEGAVGATSVVLPALTLAMYPAAQITRVLRASVLEVITSDYVRSARARGAQEWQITLSHVLRNALLPIITMLGLQLNLMLGGAVIVENVFAWPGIGTLIVKSLLASDYPVAQAVVLVIAAMVIVVNLATDLTYAVIDPRIKYG